MKISLSLPTLGVIVLSREQFFVLLRTIRECGIQGNSLELFTFNSKILLLFTNICLKYLKRWKQHYSQSLTMLFVPLVFIGPCCLHVYALNIRKRKQGDKLKNLRAHHKFVTSSRRAFVTSDDTVAEPVALIMLYSH